MKSPDCDGCIGRVDERDGENDEQDHHSDDGEDEQLASAGDLRHEDGDDGRHHVDGAKDGVLDVVGVDLGVLEDGGQVEHDGVNAGQLLHELQRTSEPIYDIIHDIYNIIMII